jgi:hypothetical protein
VYFIVLRRKKGKNTDEANCMCIRNTLDESWILSGAGIWVSLNIVHKVLAGVSHEDREPAGWLKRVSFYDQRHAVPTHTKGRRFTLVDPVFHGASS